LYTTDTFISSSHSVLHYLRIDSTSLNNLRILKSVSRGSSVSIVSGYGWTTGRSRFDPRQRQRICSLASVSRPVLGPTQPPVQWVPRVLSPGLKRGRRVTLTTHPHLMPSRDEYELYLLSIQAPAWRVVGQL
jgi:hypothetical protein